MPTDTVRLTVAQAIVTYLSRQYSVADGQRRRLIPAALGIFGHGNVAGLGQALDQLSDALPFIQGRNEQALVHVATAYAKASRRHATLAVTASIGPGALNMVTGAGLATVNRLPVLLLPGDSYATRRQGPVLQQLQHPIEADTSVNDAFRPLARFFDRITRPEQLLDRPAAGHAGADRPGRHRSRRPRPAPGHPVARLRLPGRAVRRARLDDPPPTPDPGEVETVARLLAQAQRPLIIAGGGVVYSGATPELEALAASAGIPVAETFAGKGAVQQRAWWQLGGIGLEGTPATNDLAREADLVLTVGSRLTDFATASQSLFQPTPTSALPASTSTRTTPGGSAPPGSSADAKRALAALADAVQRAGTTSPADWQERARARNRQWQVERAAALDPETPFDFSPCRRLRRRHDTGAVLTQGQIIGLLQEHARAGDVIIAAAGGPPGDLEKVWDATEGRLPTSSSGSPAWAMSCRPPSACAWPNPTPPGGSSRSWATAPS